MIFNKNVKDNKLFNIIIIFLLLIFVLFSVNIYRKYHDVTKVQELSFVNKEISIETNDFIKLKFKSNPTLPSSKFEWTSSNDEIATIDNRGYLKTLSPGEVTITIKASNMKAECQITVIESKNEVDK